MISPEIRFSSLSPGLPADAAENFADKPTAGYIWIRKLEMPVTFFKVTGTSFYVPSSEAVSSEALSSGASMA